MESHCSLCTSPVLQNYRDYKTEISLPWCCTSSVHGKIMTVQTAIMFYTLYKAQSLHEQLPVYTFFLVVAALSLLFEDSSAPLSTVAKHDLELISEFSGT